MTTLAPGSKATTFFITAVWRIFEHFTMFFCFSRQPTAKNKIFVTWCAVRDWHQNGMNCCDFCSHPSRALGALESFHIWPEVNFKWTVQKKISSNKRRWERYIIGYFFLSDDCAKINQRFASIIVSIFSAWTIILSLSLLVSVPSGIC